MKSKSLSFVLLLLCAFSTSYAQISEGGQPYSFTHQVSASIEVKEMPGVDTEALLREDESAPEDEPYRFGYGFDVSYSLQNSGAWDKLPDGSKLWRLKLISQSAYSINLIYDNFWLPEGAKFFIYNNDKSMVIGAFTSRNNKPHGKFATGLVKGDKIILEYYEPAHVTRAGDISISRVVHVYRDFFNGMSKRHLKKTTGFGDSEDCNNNVHCPEAEDWQDEVRSVGMIVLGDGTRLCTGSLLNNVNENYAPYFLTANHCLVGDLDTWVIWFNYESSTCDNPQQAPTAQTLVGTSLKANNSDSDFALLILDETPPLDYNVYYNGWSNINTAATSSVAIHHPSGDIKKISYEDDQAISDTWSGTPANSHWRVTFDDGTTEPGSSGAPLINQDHRVVGQNHGGTGDPYCENRTKWYGKFSMSWNYGGSSSTRLRDWLDPDNTSATVLDGMEDGMLSEGELPANAIWSGTHTVTGNITIPSGITLTIESGSIINFASGKKLTVNGILSARGNYNNEITFQAQSGSWYGIEVNSSGHFNPMYCNFDDAQYPIRYYGSDGDVERCDFADYTRAIKYENYASGRIQYSTFIEYTGTGIEYSQYSGGDIRSYNQIQDNYYGVKIDNSSAPSLGCYAGQGYNSIYNVMYDVYSTNSATINAQYNYWGGGDPSIYGNVNWEPALEEDPTLSKRPVRAEAPIVNAVVSYADTVGFKEFDGAYLLYLDGKTEAALALFRELVDRYPDYNVGRQALAFEYRILNKENRTSELAVRLLSVSDIYDGKEISGLANAIRVGLLLKHGDFNQSLALAESCRYQISRHQSGKIFVV